MFSYCTFVLIEQHHVCSLIQQVKWEKNSNVPYQPFTKFWYSLEDFLNLSEEKLFNSEKDSATGMNSVPWMNWQLKNYLFTLYLVGALRVLQWMPILTIAITYIFTSWPQFQTSMTCAGAATMMLFCNLDACPPNAEWTTWSEWGDCSVECGLGRRERNRACKHVKGTRWT